MFAFLLLTIHIFFFLPKTLSLFFSLMWYFEDLKALKNLTVLFWIDLGPFGAIEVLAERLKI